MAPCAPAGSSLAEGRNGRGASVMVVTAGSRYFVIIEDGDSDFDENGLDDDERVMAAVMAHLGMSPSPSSS